MVNMPNPQLDSLIFRHAMRDDLEAVIDLLADDDLGASREDAGRPLNKKYTDAFKAIDQDQNQYLAVVEAAGQVVGCLQLSFIPGLSRLGMWRGQIESVRIAKSQRGSGLGREMFEWAIDECRRRECGLIQLTSDKTRGDALRFYQSLGFEASHEGFKLSL
jgi:ribosomal protein S18 acetylase RimI-like enzyme